jgi:hypothetical protein
MVDYEAKGEEDNDNDDDDDDDGNTGSHGKTFDIVENFTTGNPACQRFT